MNIAQVEIKALAAQVLRKYRLEPVPDEEIVHGYFSPVAAIPSGIRLNVAPLA